MLHFNISQIFIVNLLIPLITILPPVVFYGLEEPLLLAPSNLIEQIRSLWEMVQLSSVYRPCTFIFIYNSLFLGNPVLTYLSNTFRQ